MAGRLWAGFVGGTRRRLTPRSWRSGALVSILAVAAVVGVLVAIAGSSRSVRVPEASGVDPGSGCDADEPQGELSLTPPGYSDHLHAASLDVESVEWAQAPARLELSSFRPGEILPSNCAEAGVVRPIGDGLAPPGHGRHQQGSASGRSAPATGRPTHRAGPTGHTATAAPPAGQTDQPPGKTTTTELRLQERNPPEVSQLRAGGEVPDGPDVIADDPACGSTTIPIEAVVIDQSAIRSVTLHWGFEGGNGPVTGSTAMQASAGKYIAVLGPFPKGTAPHGASATIRWWVEASDRHGNMGRADAPDGTGSLGDDERVSLGGCTG